MKFYQTTNATTRPTVATRWRNGGEIGWPKIRTGKILFAVYQVNQARLVLDRGLDRLPGRHDWPDLENYLSNLHPDVKSPPIKSTGGLFI